MIVSDVTLNTFLNRSWTDLHIPIGTKKIYVTDAGALWTGFNSVFEDILSTSIFKIANEIKVIISRNKLIIISAETTHLSSYTIYAISGAKIKEGTESTIA